MGDATEESDLDLLLVIGEGDWRLNPLLDASACRAEGCRPPARRIMLGGQLGNCPGSRIDDEIK